MLCSADMQQGSKSVDRGYDIVVPLIHDEVMRDAMRSWYVWHFEENVQQGERVLNSKMGRISHTVWLVYPGMFGCYGR